MNKKQKSKMAPRLHHTESLNDVKEVHIFRRGDEIVLKRKPQNLAKVFELLTEISDDFMADGRCQPSMQERESL
ncbi:antitoxin [Desulfosarcina ovata]|uniref:Uncharacterized protein n=1 Tax=Desulfosarcina ovata subsp. ovata TaxID=2752305 RepID=A0A5K8A7Y6_9BACT|nr:AbrB/MazE/SpoVT family DNA-binding domain-containing protein [Desulfosarcina ovata]BBO88576.1 hypothetical protein DSCOOX_17560 [Desulfosarcina ovata subsp. ovata]